MREIKRLKKFFSLNWDLVLIGSAFFAILLVLTAGLVTAFCAAVEKPGPRLPLFSAKEVKTWKPSTSGHYWPYEQFYHQVLVNPNPNHELKYLDVCFAWDKDKTVIAYRYFKDGLLYVWVIGEGGAKPRELGLWMRFDRTEPKMANCLKCHDKQLK